MAKTSKNLEHLTDEFAATAQCKAGRYTVYQDIGTPCFSMRVMDTGSKTWLMRNRTYGERSLGLCSEIKASKARVLAEETLEQLMTGKIGSKLAIHKRPVTDEVTLRSALAMFERTQHPRDTYMKGMTTTLSIYAEDLLDVPMAGITKDTAVSTVAAAWERSLRQGDLLKTYCNRLYKNENLSSPFVNIKNKWKSNSTPYSVPVELMPRLLDSIEELRNIGTRDLVWTALMTGFRPLSVVAMEWQHLCLEEGNASYFITADAIGFKGGKSWKYPLPEFLAAKLRKRKETQQFGPWVWHSPADSEKHMTSYREAILRIRQLAGMPLLQPYHLRDTRATYVERFFGQTLVTQRLLNHRPDYVPDQWLIGGKMVPTSDSTHRYVLTEEAEMRDYVERYTSVVLQLGGMQPISPVVRAVFLENRALALAERMMEVEPDFQTEFGGVIQVE